MSPTCAPPAAPSVSCRWSAIWPRKNTSIRAIRMNATSAATVKHAGGCHCGRVRFEVEAAARIEVAECNCSICAKVGYLHLIVAADRFRLLSGARRAHHLYVQHGRRSALFLQALRREVFLHPSIPPGRRERQRALPRRRQRRIDDGAALRWPQLGCGARRVARHLVRRRARQSAAQRGCRHRTTNRHNQAMLARYVQARARSSACEGDTVTRISRPESGIGRC